MMSDITPMNPRAGPMHAVANATRYPSHSIANASPTDTGAGARCSPVPSNRLRCVSGRS